MTPADGGQQALVARLRRMGLGELRDLADHYTAIAAMCAELAALRADPDDVERLRELAASGRGVRSGAARWRAEGNFHLELAAAAQSARLTREEMALQSEVGMLLWLSHAQAGEDATPADRHTELVDSIAVGDADKARLSAESPRGRDVLGRADARTARSGPGGCCERDSGCGTGVGAGRWPRWWTRFCAGCFAELDTMASEVGAELDVASPRRSDFGSRGAATAC